MTVKTNGCQLEVDVNRGVAYVHSPQGKTLLRVCQIPRTVAGSEFIDVVFDRELAKTIEEIEVLVVLKAQGMTNEEATVFLEGVRKGLKARKEGKVRPWSQIKKELGLQTVRVRRRR